GICFPYALLPINPVIAVIHQVGIFGVHDFLALHKRGRQSEKQSQQEKGYPAQARVMEKF
ncbi:MAG: hypothetical protein FWH25_04830, partial [Syntrophorhabdaceae bacterium]|nr:hypothetical protein [Syntrophorhabdaceae bacterium]